MACISGPDDKRFLRIEAQRQVVIDQSVDAMNRMLSILNKRKRPPSEPTL